MKDLRTYMLYAAFSLCFFSCCKDPDDCREDINPNCQGLPFKYYARYDPAFAPFLFKVGSWWDYKNTITGDVKRMSITQSYIHNDTLPFLDDGFRLVWEQYHIIGSDEIMNKNFYDKFDKNQAFRREAIVDPDFGAYILRESVFFTDSTGNLANLQVQSFTYSNVDYFRLPKAKYANPYYDTDVFMYWAPNNGLIKLEKVDTLNNLLESWELINKNVVL